MLPYVICVVFIDFLMRCFKNIVNIVNCACELYKVNICFILSFLINGKNNISAKVVVIFMRNQCTCYHFLIFFLYCYKLIQGYINCPHIYFKKHWLFIGKRYQYLVTAIDRSTKGLYWNNKCTNYCIAIKRSFFLKCIFNSLCQFWNKYFYYFIIWWTQCLVVGKRNIILLFNI